MKIHRPYSLFTVVAMSLLIVVLGWTGRTPRPLAWDVHGYYLYLPQALIHDDLALHDLDSAKARYQRMSGTDYFYQAQKLKNGNAVMKYTLGMSVAYLPAFAVGHAAAKWSGAATDGLSTPYQTALGLWSLLISLAGVWLFRHMLLRFFSDPVAAILLVSVVLGSNFLANVLLEGQGLMTHNFLFAAYSSLIVLCDRWHARPDWKRMLPLALLCGWMVLVRPTEVVCLFLPLLWTHGVSGGWRGKLALLGQAWAQVLGFGLGLALVFLPQMLYWKTVTGQWLYLDYGGNAGEGFDWANPHVWEVLFSYRKGWWVYTPLAAIGLAGMYWMPKRLDGLILPLALCLAGSIYLVSSWSMWWYSISFGQRALIPMLPLLALGLGSLLSAQWNHALRRGLVLACLTLLVLLSVFQNLQYSQGVIHGSRMTAAAYWRVFGRWTAPAATEALMLVDRGAHCQDSIPFPHLYAAQELTHGAHLDLRAGKKYGPTWSVPFSSVTLQDHAYLQVNARIRQHSPGMNRPLSANFHFTHRGRPYGFRSIRPLLEPGAMVPFEALHLSAELRAPADSLHFFLQYHGPDSLWVEDFVLRAHTRTDR